MLAAACDALQLRECVILRLAIFGGFRPGEILGLPLFEALSTSPREVEMCYQSLLLLPFWTLVGMCDLSSLFRVARSPGFDAIWRVL
jgi:hypothetical protein